MWARNPIDPKTGELLEPSDLAAYLLGENSAAPVALEIVPRRLLGDHASSAANRVIAVVDRDELTPVLNATRPDGGPADNRLLDSLLLDEDMVAALTQNDHIGFLERRAIHLRNYLREFLDDKTGFGFEVTPPLSDFNFDEDEDDEAAPLTDPSEQELQ